MELNEERVDRIVVLSMNGRLDAVTTSDFTNWSDRQSFPEGHGVILDMEGLNYISSAGLRGILTVAKRIRAGKGSLAVCGLSGVVRDVFHVSGFSTILETYSTREAALAAVQEVGSP